MPGTSRRITPSGNHPLQAATGLVMAGGSQGTGYLVAQEYAATCAHVVHPVGEGGSVTITFDGVERLATVTRIDTESDAALLKLAAPLTGVEPLPLGGGCEWKAPWDGFGFPRAGRGAGIPLEGVVMNPAGRDDRQVPVMVLASQQVAAGMAVPVHGFSGSPVMVEGTVVGHLKRIIPDPDSDAHAPRPAFGLVYATPAGVVARLLGVQPAVSVVLTPDPDSPSDNLPELGEGEYHVLLSYRSTDQAWAKALVARLEGVGFRTFVDQRELLPDDRLVAARRDALARCRAAVVLLSNAWLDSPSCRAELRAALERAASDKRFQVVLARIDDCEAPQEWGRRDCVDFAGQAGPEGPELIKLQYAIRNQRPPVAGARSSRVIKAETEATDDLVRELRAATAQGARRVFALWNQWHDAGMPTGSAALVAAQSLIQLANPDLAVQVLESAAPGIRADQLRALALSKVGKVDDAIVILTRLRDTGDLGAETLGLLAGRLKQKWEEGGGGRFLESAVRVYAEAFERTADPYPGINAAALLLQQGKKADGASTALKVLEALERVAPDDVDQWKLATKAEALLIAGQPDPAREWYGQAVARDPLAVENIATMRRQARRNLEALGKNRADLDDLLTVPRVVAFAGHVVDAPGRKPPRFPPEKVGAARRVIRDRLKELQVGFGFSSAARGGDLIFIEEVLDRGGSAHVFLPFPRDQFARSSVGQGWDDRLHRVLGHERAEVIALSERELPEDTMATAYVACTWKVQQGAIAFAKRLDETPLLLCLWDGKSGDGAGGTADAVRAWDDEGYDRVTIDVSKL